MDKSNVPDEIADEAITWFARLRADDVSLTDREGFFQWLKISRVHQQAFVEVLHLWEGVSVLAGLDPDEIKRFPPVVEFKRRVELARS